MSVSGANQVNEIKDEHSSVNLEAVNRIAKLPVVESTIQTATSLYGKVKVRISSSFFKFHLLNNTIFIVLLYGFNKIQNQRSLHFY